MDQRKQKPGTQLTAAIRRFEHWRRRHGGPGRRLPDELWELAVQVSRVQGAPETARALRLDVARLEERLEIELGPLREGASGDECSRLEFVELGASEVGAAGRSAIKVVSAAGDRLHIDTAAPLDVAGLVRVFCERRS